MKRTTGSPDAWLRPAGVPTLTDADVHVWRAWLGLDSPHLATMRPLLSPDELTRADRLHFDRDRSRFISARAILRILLGSYLSTEPGQLRFRYSLHGKPALADANERRTLCFNLSHSHELALYAVAIKRPLGIDVERVRPDLPYEQMARHVLSRREDAALHALPAELRPEAFIRLWTRKEAYVKATGKGLAISLDQLDLSPPSGEQSPFSDLVRGPREGEPWSLVALVPRPGYAGALVAAGSDWSVTCWEWPEHDMA